MISEIVRAKLAEAAATIPAWVLSEADWVKIESGDDESVQVSFSPVVLLSSNMDKLPKA